jgi:hypothetical protein
MVGGPIGALMGGVTGAFVGSASAQGKEPIKKTVARLSSIGKTRTAQTKKSSVKAKRSTTTRKKKSSGTSGTNRAAVTKKSVRKARAK